MFSYFLISYTIISLLCGLKYVHGFQLSEKLIVKSLGDAILSEKLIVNSEKLRSGRYIAKCKAVFPDRLFYHKTVYYVFALLYTMLLHCTPCSPA